jgi:pSer/pThr/pTyr-binding forkhead associated (FHA) protein
MEDQSTHALQGPHWRPRLVDGTVELTPLRLVVEGGELTLTIDRPEMVAGRHSDADLRLPLPDVSRRHCRFMWREGRWQVIDLNSLNGLWVNDRLVQHVFLEQGDRLRIGSFAFVVNLNGETNGSDEPRSLYSVLASLPRLGEAPRRLAS